MSTKSNNTLIKTHRRRHASAAKSARKQLVLCLETGGYEASLESRKIYVSVPDRDAAKHDQLRVIDESGEDYLFPAALFVPIRVPITLRRALLAAV